MSRYHVSFSCHVAADKVDRDALAERIWASLLARPTAYDISHPYLMYVHFRGVSALNKMEATKFARSIRTELAALLMPYGGSCDDFDVRIESKDPVESFELTIESTGRSYRVFSDRAFVAVPSVTRSESNDRYPRVHLAFRGGKEACETLHLGQAFRVADPSGSIEIRLVALPDNESENWVARLLLSRFDNEP